MGSGRAGRFDGWAAWYDDSALQPLVYQPVHDVVLRHVVATSARPVRVLDVGCGTGRLAGRMAQCLPGAAVVGVDSSTSMADRARIAARRGTAITVVQARAECLPFTGAVFDVVTVTLSVRHWVDPAAGLAEIGRVLIVGGWCVLADILDDMFEDVFDSRDRNGQGHRGRLPGLRWRRADLWLPASLRSAFDAAGLTIAGAELVPAGGPIPPVTVVVATRR